MLNQKKRLYKSKSKSKIFITILCIFGLLFSYSCSCKNRVSDPNETPINGGNGGSAGKDDSGQIIRTNGGAVSGDYQIVVANDGTTVSTTATVKFLNATGKLTKVEDSATDKAFELADLSYSGTTLTLTDSGKAKATEGEFRTIKATFSLTKSADNVDLTATEQVVDIKIGKMAKSDNASILNAISEDLKNLGTVLFADSQSKNGTFAFHNNTVESDTIKVVNFNKFTDNATINTSGFTKGVDTQFKAEKGNITKITKMEFDSVSVSDDKKTATFKYKIFLIDVYEKTFETTPLSIVVPVDNVTWTDDINNPTN